MISIVFYKLSKENFKIGDALKENMTIEISEDRPQKPETPKPAADGNIPIAVAPTEKNEQPPFIPKTIQPKSTSRLLAFISGLTSVGLASCICSFWMYNVYVNNKDVDYGTITNVLLTLGIGVIPYAVNKFNSKN